MRFSEGGRIRESGVEDLRAVSFWQIDGHGQDDTAHADPFVVFDRMHDGWARNIAAEHFTPNVQGMFRTGRQSLGITIEIRKPVCTLVIEANAPLQIEDLGRPRIFNLVPGFEAVPVFAEIPANEPLICRLRVTA